MSVPPVVRIWSRVRELDWNQFWMMDRILRRTPEVAAVLQNCGLTEIDLFPDPLGELEVLVHGAGADQVCHSIQISTRNPWTIATDDEFHAATRSRGMYARQYFEPWDEALPCFILGVDFDMGMDRWRRPARPELWRHIHHYADNHSGDWRIISGLVLEPTGKGTRLLEELTTRFENWCPGGHGGRPPLDAILDYRQVLRRYGVDCNEAFRNHLVEAWYPIDIEREEDRQGLRELCSTPLPDDLGELIGEANGDPVPRYRIFFKFVALTENWN